MFLLNVSCSGLLRAVAAVSICWESIVAWAAGTRIGHVIDFTLHTSPKEKAHRSGLWLDLDGLVVEIELRHVIDTPFSTDISGQGECGFRAILQVVNRLVNHLSRYNDHLLLLGRSRQRLDGAKLQHRRRSNLTQVSAAELQYQARLVQVVQLVGHLGPAVQR